MTDVSTQIAPLEALLEDISALNRRGTRPIAVFDIDDTLLSTARRHMRILREFAQEKKEAAELARVDEDRVCYLAADTAQAYGIHDPELLGELKRFWFARFFRNEYLLADEPLPGAAAYCRDLQVRGATVVYLTGRDESMREGTLQTLERYGFPVPQDDSMILKPRFDTPDLEFKTDAMRRLAQMGRVAGAFENEPAHINLFQNAFPQSKLFFVETRHSGKPIMPHPFAYRIKDFSRRLPD